MRRLILVVRYHLKRHVYETHGPLNIWIVMVIVDNKQALDLELAKAKRTLVLFYASWCPHCIRFIPLFKEKTADLTLSIVQVRMDDYDSPLWDDYEVATVPTVILFEDRKVSRRLDSLPGNCIKDEKFTAWLQEIK
ncbi:MAG: thioredoxin family protein [Nitrososphaerota archaeon]|nr:thioredoxin family protein [Nitrososphaerota archaeon]